MAETSFAQLLAYIEAQCDVLKGLGKDLKSCLRTGAGTHGHEANPERMKHYKLYCKLEKNLTEKDKEALKQWEDQICGDGAVLQPAVDAEFKRLLHVFQSREDELKGMRKCSLEECFGTNLSNTDPDLKFCRNFYQRKKAHLSEEHQKVLAEWSEKICGDGAMVRSAIDADFLRLIGILERREDEFKSMRKRSLEECFGTNLSNTDPDLQFCRNFYRRKKPRLSEEHQKVLAEWSEKICGDGAMLRSAIDADFLRLIGILERREDEFKSMRKRSLEECFGTNLSNTDPDLQFCRNFYQRKKARLSEEHQKVLAEWSEKICGDGAMLRSAIDADFRRLIGILERREDEFKSMRKRSLEECFGTNLSNTDPDLQFCRNFYRRKKACLSEEHQKVLAEWSEKICGDGAMLRSAIDADFRRLIGILERREDEFKSMRKRSLEECFGTNLSNTDPDLQFCRNFYRRKKARLSEEHQKVLAEWSEKICGDGAVLWPAVDADTFQRFVSILDSRAQELIALRKHDLKAVFSSHICKTDLDLKFCQNFWQRNADKLSTQQQQQVEDLSAVLLWPRTPDDRAALRPAIVRMVVKFEGIIDRRKAELIKLGAASVQGLFARHSLKTDSELRFCYDFLGRVFPRLEDAEQQRLRSKLDEVLVKSCAVPLKAPHEAELHVAETVLGDALPRPRLPKSLRQLFGNSMDAEARIMPFFHRVHEVDEYMVSLQFQDCDYCHEGWFGSSRKKEHLPGGFESEAYKKTNFLRAPEGQWLDSSRPICQNCLLEAKRRAAEGYPKEPVRLTATNFADPGFTLPETDALSFFEEEILSPIQHIVRIFTLHSTGQCELRGHVGNLFQNGPQYVRNIPAAIGDMKMLLIRRCPKDPNRKQRVPFLVSRRRLERALDRVCRSLEEGGSLALQPGALTPGGYVELLKKENLEQYADTEEGEEPHGLQVEVVEQTPWERVERKLFAMWMSCSLELQMAAQVRLWHEPQDVQDPAERMDVLWQNLRAAMDAKAPDVVGGPADLMLKTLAQYLSLQLSDKSAHEVENILHDELTAVQELASWEEPLVSDGLWSPEDVAGQQTEAELKDELWEAVCTANESGSNKSTIRRFGAARVQGVPILDPPTVASRNQLIREDQPYYIVAGFVKLFPLGHGDFWAHLQQRQEENQQPLSFWEWLKHLLLRSDGRFQAHPRFYFFALNTALRNKALRARGYFMKRQQGASNNVAYTTEELFNMGKAQFTKIVSAFEHSMVGSAQEKLRQRSDLEAMVEQIEQETLQDQAHALLQSWQTVELLEPQAGAAVTPELQAACLAAKAAVEKVLSPETIAAQAKPSVSRVVVDRGTDDAVESDVALVDVDRAADPLQQEFEISFPEQDCAFVGARPGSGRQTLQSLLSEVQQRSLCVQGGGEIPCHFTTLTTAIYHWDDLAQCLEQYEAAVRKRRGDRVDPLEPAERQLSPERRRVLRYPGVVAWFTAYKMELFYKHVLRYEDGHGVFEWGAGGIMHLHSINFGSCMPRIDPTAAGMQQPDEKTAEIAAQFAEMHEEYLTDWSFAKAEKWSFHEIDNCVARTARPVSPVHTESESDGSEDMDESALVEKCVRRKTLNAGLQVGLSADVFGQHAVADDVDFQRVFPTATSMVYVISEGTRATKALTQDERQLLQDLDLNLQDAAWHACRISVKQKALLMTNNCRLVRRARRKWYRRLTEKCNMHDRHAGLGFEVPPVYIEATRDTDTEEEKLEVVTAQLQQCSLRCGTLNMHLLSPGPWFEDLLEQCDVMFLQEVTRQCLEDLCLLGPQIGYEVVSPLLRGQAPAEGFDVCLLLKRHIVQSRRVTISPLPLPSSRRFVQVHVTLPANGCVLALATAHFTAGSNAEKERECELAAVLASLEALSQVDCCVFAGDLNMRSGEGLPAGVSSRWRDAWQEDGSAEDRCGTWCPDTAPVQDARVRAWRFDRILTLCQFGSMDKSSPTPLRAGAEAAERVSFATVELQPGSFDVQFQAAELDHAFVFATFNVMPLAAGARDVSSESLKVLRPGLGPKIARRPLERESCAQRQHAQSFCGKDYEKPRMLPGMGAILEDSRRKSLFRLYTRRNCHHLNTHDPLKAMGLVANVDDQVVLTVQAAVNYLTKYLGKIGGGHSAHSRISGLIDDIVCRMGDRETMTVASLLSKLFIHSAVPEEICSLEAWHVLLDLPRVLSSRYVTSLNVKEDSNALKDLASVELARADENVVKKSKVALYLDRFNMRAQADISAASLENMSLFQFISRMDRRGKSLHLRKKSIIVKERPFLRLDARRKEAGAMARLCLRLRRPFRTEGDDPIHLEEALAVTELHAFVQSPTCPVWLKKRYAKHNRVKAHRRPDAAADSSQRHDGAEVCPAVPGASAASVPVVAAATMPASPAIEKQHGVHGAEVCPAVPALVSSEPKAASAVHVINLSAGHNPEESGAEDIAESNPDVNNKFLADTPSNRQMIANRHGLLWICRPGDRRHSIVDAVRLQRPPLKMVCVKQYLEALTETKPEGSKKVQFFTERFVFLMLYIDLQPYSKRGAGVFKQCLSKTALQNLANAFFQSQGSGIAAKQKRNVVLKPYAELWEYIKAETLRQCGLAVSSSPAHRVGFDGPLSLPHPELKTGAWRQSVFCLEPHSLEHEEWEDAADREAKRLRYVQAAMHEQSMGRPGKKLHEVALPVDADALMCADFDTRAEWDALNPYLDQVRSVWLWPELAVKVFPETKGYVLKPTQGGLAHTEAEQISVRQDRSSSSATGPVLDPTQDSFVQHMRAWMAAYTATPGVCEANLPLPQHLQGSLLLNEPALLLGTAGTGKTTTLQAANQLLEAHGLKGRIVRCAYTGVAASNMGSGGRTLVSLFRLNKRKFGGGLEPLSFEDLRAMDEELRGMCLLEIDELSMTEKLILAHVHQRLQQWRVELYHDRHCRSRAEVCPATACVCGARLPFGGVKVVLAGDFGQLPPVAVPPERTLLCSKAKSVGQDRHDVNLGLRLFQQIRVVFRLRRIHRQVGQSLYKESLLRLRDAAHTKEDVQLWKSHDLTDVAACTLTVEERKFFEGKCVHLFCENRRAGQFNGRRLGEDVAAKDKCTILRVWSNDSTPGVERYTSENYGGLKRVLHLAEGAPVMLTMNLRTVWNLVNGARGHVVAVLPVEQEPSVSGDRVEPGPHVAEPGGVSAAAAEYVIVDFPGYVGPLMVAGHPTWVCIPKQTNRHEKFKGLARTQFPLVLCYGMTVHKSQGLTLSSGCVFNMEHEPTWSPFKQMCGLAFVGFSRVTDFSKMAFKYVPDYWTFQSMVDTDMFRWRAALEQRLDELHDQTAEIIFEGRASVQEDVQRHVAWSESLKGAEMSPEEVADLTHMLSLRGVLPQPGYTDKPVRRLASKAGGGRIKRKTMRGVSAQTSSLPGAQSEVGARELQCDEGGASAEEEAYYASLREDEELEKAGMEAYLEDKALENAKRTAREMDADFYDDEGYVDDF